MNREGRRFKSCRACFVCSNRAATKVNVLKTRVKHQIGNVLIRRYSVANLLPVPDFCKSYGGGRDGVALHASG
jgi:hypothetical protein